jgi:SAM-dependent methyltransferase
MDTPTPHTPAASPEPQTFTQGPEAVAVTQAMRSLYDHYFACHDYDRRYPTPNRRTLAFALSQGAGQAQHILDFGCGSGRYALPLLRMTAAQVTGYDISAQALAEFQAHVQQAGLTGRARALGTTLAALDGAGDYDLVVMLFGVLSHTGTQTQRIGTLREVRALMRPGARLVLSVPNIWRRRPMDVLRAAWLRRRGRVSPELAEPGSLWFSRVLGGQRRTFFYHLYSPAQLSDELRQAGFELVDLQAESLLPEWLITQRRWLGRWDAALSRWLPPAWGYGLMAAAVVRTQEA